MKLKIPPVIVVIIVGCLMWAISKWITFSLLVVEVPGWLIKVGLGCAVFITFLSLVQFSRNKTTVDPHSIDKVSALVTSGAYRFSRNPMYLAMLMLLVVIGLKFGNLLPLVLLPVFVWYMNRFQIIPEEEVLAEKFGSEYEAYKSKVRRWL